MYQILNHFSLKSIQFNNNSEFKIMDSSSETNNSFLLHIARSEALYTSLCEELSKLEEENEELDKKIRLQEDQLILCELNCAKSQQEMIKGTVREMEVAFQLSCLLVLSISDSLVYFHRENLNFEDVNTLTRGK